MLEKQKKWCQNKVEKGKEWLKKNKGAIGFGLGAATMTALYLLAEKLDEPQEGNITYMRHLEDGKPDITARVYYKNRFGKEKNPLNIRYGYTDPELNELCNNLNEIVYPGD